MTDDKDLIAPSDYFSVAGNKKEIWQKIIGQRLTHKTLGEGTIFQDSFSKKIPRESYLLVKFDSGRESLFALDAFNGDKITKLSLSDELIAYIHELDKLKKQKEEEERKQVELEVLRKIQEEENKKRVLLAEEQRLVRIQNEKERINDVINKIIISTTEHINSLPNLQKLNDVLSYHHYGQYNYSDIFEQCLYLLRYFYAYYYEYRKIMEWVCGQLSEVNVVSIGCGSGIDALALKYASDDKNLKAHYTGIDINKWWTELIIPEDGHINIHNVFIKEASDNYLKNASVLFFPKSLSDISNVAMSDIIKWIERCACTTEKICIAASFIYTGNKEVAHISGIQYDRYNKIIELFKSKNYFEDDTKRNELKIDQDSTAHVWKVDDEVFINTRPINLIDFFKEIPNTCNKYSDNKVHCDICPKNLSGKFDYPWPKLSAASIHYKSTILIKKGSAAYDTKC